ncbi:MAG: choice-of-anchor Q domain-containing protein [Deinococcota bacterium]
MATANDGDTITFQAGLSGTIFLNSVLFENLNNLTIDGTSANITLDGQNTHRIFFHIGAGDFTIINMTLQHGYDFANGGGIYSNGTVNIVDSTVSGSHSGGGSGGGVMGFTAVNVTGSVISDNSADAQGGGVFSQGVITISSNSTISGNSATYGGGLYSNANNVVIESSTISGNNATFAGAGIYSGFNTGVSNDSVISGNTAGFSGGGLYSLANTQVENSTISGNRAIGIDGGGIASVGNVIVRSSSIFDNSAGDNGGGVSGSNHLTVLNSIVAGNSSVNSGGGGLFSNTTITVTNSAVYGNIAGGLGGGGMFAVDAIVVNNSTIVGNSTNDDGGGIATLATATLNNSVVLGNTATTHPEINVVPSLNNSAFGVAAGESTGDTFVGFTVADVFVAPEAAAAAPTTAGDYRLVTNSPGIDAGDDALAAGIVTDLTGNPRIAGAAVDMGAFEGGFSNKPVVNPNQDIQLRNGADTNADVITSYGLTPLSYGPFKRNQTVVLPYLVRNPGAQVLELGELSLPNFMSLHGDALPASLGSFESALLEVAVDTSVAGTLEGQVSLASNDPDANENPFVFDVVVQVDDDPAHAVYVLAGIDLAEVNVQAGDVDVPLLSFKLLVPTGSVDVTLDSIRLDATNLLALDSAESLQVYIDGGTRGELDALDVPLATLNLADADALTFEFPTRTLAPELPLWLLVVGDF